MLQSCKSCLNHHPSCQITQPWLPYAKLHLGLNSSPLTAGSLTREWEIIRSFGLISPSYRTWGGGVTFRARFQKEMSRIKFLLLNSGTMKGLRWAVFVHMSAEGLRGPINLISTLAASLAFILIKRGQRSHSKSEYLTSSINAHIFNSVSYTSPRTFLQADAVAFVVVMFSWINILHIESAF